MKRIKLIWDFRGPDSKKIAEHHTVHLKEFALSESLSYHQTNVVELSPMHSIAFITVDEQNMKIFRDALKPHRGELA